MNSALTRWLNQGLSLGMCPLCRVAEKLDQEYVRNFSDEWSSEEWAIEAFAAARGFCAEHAQQLKVVEVDGLRSTIGISELYLAAAERLERDLADLEDDAWLERSACPACVNRRDGVAKHGQFLFAALRHSASFRGGYERSNGVCMDHFQLLWDTSPSEEQRALIKSVQLRAISHLAEDLREHLRKQRVEFRHEPPGREQDSWQRGMWLTGGWPPAPTSASARRWRGSSSARSRPAPPA